MSKRQGHQMTNPSVQFGLPQSGEPKLKEQSRFGHAAASEKISLICGNLRCLQSLLKRLVFFEDGH
jgi:hypothetical protein